MFHMDMEMDIPQDTFSEGNDEKRERVRERDIV